MCLNTLGPKPEITEGIGCKVFRLVEGQLFTALNHFAVKQGEWIKNVYSEDIGSTFGGGPIYRAGFHILTERTEAFSYLAHEYGFVRRPWHINFHQWRIFPVQYRAAHTQGTQYGYKVVVADELYVLTRDETSYFSNSLRGID